MTFEDREGGVWIKAECPRLVPKSTRWWRAVQVEGFGAIEQYEKTLELDSAFAVTYWGLALAYGFSSQHEAPIASMKRGMQLSGAPTFIALSATSTPRLVVGPMGNRYCKVCRKSRNRDVLPYLVARIYAALGEKDEALRWLETACRERAVSMVLLKTDPRFENLRSDPRFQDLMRRMSFPAWLHTSCFDSQGKREPEGEKLRSC